MGCEPKTYAQDWITGEPGGQSVLTPEDMSLARELVALGKEDHPDAGFVAQTASQLANLAERIRTSGGHHSKERQSFWSGMQRAWQWGAGLAGIAILLAVLIFSLNLIPRSAVAPGAARPAPAQPTPASQVITGFTWQTDGLCGYRMLRPEGWNASPSECRFYTLPGAQDQADRLVLRAINYQVLADQMSNGLIAQYGLFEQNPTLDGWTQGIEQMWGSNGIEFTLLETLSGAKIYALSAPGSNDLQIMALAIHANQPLGIALAASGAYADLDRLRADGFWDDFVTMVSSAQAIPYDPANVTPVLPTTDIPQATPSVMPESTPLPVPGLPPSTPPGAQSELDLLPSPDSQWTAILDQEAGSLEVADAQGAKQTLLPAGSTASQVKWSPDSRRLAVVLSKLSQDRAMAPPEIHFLNLEGSTFNEVGAFYQAGEEAPGNQIILGAWSANSRRIAFWTGPLSASIQADGLSLWVLDTESMQAIQLSEAALTNPAYQSWAPDGSALAFSDGGYRSAQVNKWLSLYDVDAGQARPLIDQSELVPGTLAWSPAGDTIAFAAVRVDQTGDEWAEGMGWDNPAIQARRIYLLDPQSGAYRRLNQAEAYQDSPRWSAGGTKLLYVQMDGDQAVIMAADPVSGDAQPLPGCQEPRPASAGYYGQVDWTDLYKDCPEAAQASELPLSNLASPEKEARAAQMEAIDAIRNLFDLPILPLEFVEMTTMANSPTGDLEVTLYQDVEGRSYFITPGSNQVVEIDARAVLSSISPDAIPLSQEALEAKAQALIRGAMPDFEARQAGLTYETGVKGDNYFFDWRAPSSSGMFMPPFAQIGLHKSGVLFAYYNTLQ